MYPNSVGVSLQIIFYNKEKITGTPSLAKMTPYMHSSKSLKRTQPYCDKNTSKCWHLIIASS